MTRKDQELALRYVAQARTQLGYALALTDSKELFDQAVLAANHARYFEKVIAAAKPLRGGAQE